MAEGQAPGGGWGTERELLVVARSAGRGGGRPGQGADSGLEAVLAALTSRGFVVTATLPPRLALVRWPAPCGPAQPPDPAGLGLAGDGAAGTGDLVGVFTEAPPPGLRETLEPAERLFVDAWLARGRPKPPRPGEGRPWDAGGGPGEPPRLPPDPPPPGSAAADPG